MFVCFVMSAYCYQQFALHNYQKQLVDTILFVFCVHEIRAVIMILLND